MAIRGTLGKYATMKIKAEELELGAPGSTVTLSGTELSALADVTAGTITASKVVVVDADKDINEFRNVGIVNSIEDDNGNEAIKFVATGSAINEFTVTNAATGSGPTLSATGDDTNIDLLLTAKGTGAHVINNGTDPVMVKLMGAAGTFTNEITDLNGNEILALQGVTSAVNEFTIVNAATGAGPELSVQGGDTNVDMLLTAKGTGAHVLNNGTDPVTLKLMGAAGSFTNEIVDLNGNEIMALQGVASAVNELTIANAATGNAVLIGAQGGDANVNLTINGKAAGTIGIGNVSTGAVTITPATTVTGALTPTGGVVAAGGFTARPSNIHVGGQKAMLSTDGTDVTPSVSETYYGAVFIPCNMTVTGVSVLLGSATEGNMKVGLFNSAGALLATSASTDISGASADAYLRIAFTGAYAAVGPATYYVGILQDSTSNRFNAHLFGDFPASKTTGETYASGFTTIASPATTFTASLAPYASLY